MKHILSREARRHRVRQSKEKIKDTLTWYGANLPGEKSVPEKTGELAFLEENQMDSETKSDEIANPPHYCEGRTYEPKDVIHDWDLNFNLGNVVKYISRNGRKTGKSKIKDLRKARQYLDFEIEALKKEGKI